MIEVRCPHRKFAELTTPSNEEGRIEVRCPSRWCGKRTGVVVIHVFSTANGLLISTRLFREPERR